MKESREKIKHLQRNFLIIQDLSLRKSMMRSIICIVSTKISLQKSVSISGIDNILNLTLIDTANTDRMHNKED